MENISHIIKPTRLPTRQPSRGGTSSPYFDAIGVIGHTELCLQHEETHRAAAQELLLERARAKTRTGGICKPTSYRPPQFNTPEYWRDCARGWISDEQQLQDQADYETRRRRALDSKHSRTPVPHRHLRPAPRETKQFSKCMSTQAARDDRLTPQSKALLQLIVARTGRGRYTDTTKTTLGVIMSRCPRSIQRYLQELIQFGYIRTQTRKSRRSGFFIGLRIWIMNSVLPFFSKRSEAYSPELWLDLVRDGRNCEETKLSLTEDKDRFISAFREKKPPWFAEFAY